MRRENQLVLAFAQRKQRRTPERSVLQSKRFLRLHRDCAQERRFIRDGHNSKLNGVRDRVGSLSFPIRRDRSAQCAVTLDDLAKCSTQLLRLDSAANAKADRIVKRSVRINAELSSEKDFLLPVGQRRSFSRRLRRHRAEQSGSSHRRDALFEYRRDFINVRLGMFRAEETRTILPHMQPAQAHVSEEERRIPQLHRQR